MKKKKQNYTKVWRQEKITCELFAKKNLEDKKTKIYICLVRKLLYKLKKKRFVFRND